MFEEQVAEKVTLGLGQRVTIGDGEVIQVDANGLAGVAVRETVAVAVLAARARARRRQENLGHLNAEDRRRGGAGVVADAEYGPR